ncbi:MULTISPECIES: hypothetical protein [Bradyrhizobium]|jgi:hypothetical protein|nr:MULTISPECIES: hypothetical protein [Bradyrhizobium]MBR0882444.1 hypothetical protein [Bradyrhizobium liaoningense]MBR1002262.1 hypothetical protein [Bradyrhizobium liaoningense]MBR1031942.1 hypothetical protein [Bradyrhizobium liaoningense]MBR1068625.1 hypothetical protein [Bradyrhizobium liaoningense]MCP1740843.1 hypothetical protein [Bradyrhizobium japonicum]
MRKGLEVMDLSDLARRNTISLEVKKGGLTQRQSGDWQLRLTIAAIDMDSRITQAAMGTRFACVLVEVNDDETPVDHASMERDKWRDLGPAKQAGMRCKEPTFWAFLREELHYADVADEGHAADCVRHHCGVASRSDLGKPGRTEERQKWHQIDFAYQAWRNKENG